MGVDGRGNPEKGRSQGVFMGVWDGRMSCSGSLFRSASIGGGVKKLEGTSGSWVLEE